MGIYSDGKIYGISFRLDVVVYEETYEKPITLEQIKKARDFYDSISKETKDFYDSMNQPLTVSVYMKCTSTYNLGQNSFMSWVPSELDQLNIL